MPKVNKKKKMSQVNGNFEKMFKTPGWTNTLTVKRKISLQQAAQSQIEKKKKEARVNLRVSADDVGRIRELAAREGIGYQTLMVSVLHKYAQGILVDRIILDQLTESLKLKKTI